MSADEAVGQRPHGICQDVAADGLDNVFHELRPIGLDPAPLLCGIDSHVGDGCTAKVVLADSGLDVGQPPSRGQSDDYIIGNAVPDDYRRQDVGPSWRKSRP